MLASDIPANREVGLDESSYFPLGNIAALAEGLARLAQTGEPDDSRAARQRRVAQIFDWNRISEQTLEVYRRVNDGLIRSRQVGQVNVHVRARSSGVGSPRGRQSTISAVSRHMTGSLAGETNAVSRNHSREIPE